MERNKNILKVFVFFPCCTPHGAVSHTRVGDLDSIIITRMCFVPQLFMYLAREGLEYW